MSYIGKEFKLEKQENFEDFLESLGAEVTKEYKQQALAEKPTHKLEKNGDTYKLFSAGRETSFKDGVEFDETVNNKPAKTTVTVSGNTVTQVQKFPNGAFISIKREYSDGGLVSTITNSNWDGEARRYYK